MERYIIILLTIPAAAMAGCSTMGTMGHSTPIVQNSEERRATNATMIHWLYEESVRNGIVRQKTLFPYHFVPDTPLLTEIGEHDLSILVTHYKNDVLPYLTKREILKEVKIHFDYDRASIRSDAVPHLEEAVKLLADNPNADLVITGHADVRGSNEYNDTLSARRAEAVKRYMSDHSVATDRVQIVSRGEMDAMAADTDEEGMQADRNAHFMGGEMLGGIPVDLNVKRGGVSNELYSARKKTVRTYLSSHGVDTNLITLSDGMPGGDGMASEAVLLILTDTDGEQGSGGPIILEIR